MTESPRDTAPAVPALRLPGDLDELRRRRRSTGDLPDPEPSARPVKPDQPDASEDSEPNTVDAIKQEAEALRGASVGRLANLPSWAKAKGVAVIDELRPENLAKVFEPMKPIPDHPVLYRSGWIELAVLVSLSLIMVALVLLVMV